MNARAQTADSLKQETGIFTGAVTLTTKGLSTFPNLTLGKPAAILDLSMGGKKLRFEPVVRFALTGKPWSFIFWVRYELLNNEIFQLKAYKLPKTESPRMSCGHNNSWPENCLLFLKLAKI